MNRIQQVPFKPEHMDVLIMREHERELIDPAKFTEMALKNNCFTFLINGVPLCLVGWVKLWHGVADVFVVPSVHVPYFPKSFYKAVKHYLDILEQDVGLRRMQTTSLADDETDSWMEHLGFKCEGTLEQYTINKLDYRMWARLAGCPAVKQYKFKRGSAA